MTPTDFIEDFLRKRDIRKPDGRCLFEYDCDNREYSQLKRVLKRHGDPEHLRQRLDEYGQPTADEPGWSDEDELIMAAFALYGGEWCRRYEPPPKRKWALLLSEVDWKPHNYPELYAALEEGLQWWRLRIIVMPGSKRYFDTLAYQGGLFVDGLAITEYELFEEDEEVATYRVVGAPSGFQAGNVRVLKSIRSAPRRITATFNVNSD